MGGGGGGGKGTLGIFDGLCLLSHQKSTQSWSKVIAENRPSSIDFLIKLYVNQTDLPKVMIEFANLDVRDVRLE